MKYKTVVIDPPWSLKTKENHVMPHGPMPSMPYSTMTLEDIMAFPIDDFAADASLLFLWVINSKCEKRPIIHYGFEILEAWGFTYHQIITWEKLTGAAVFSPLLSRTEHCLMGVRGNLHELIDRKYGMMKNIITSSTIGAHSQKPAQFYQLLRKWTPEPRIDIFARREHPGFSGWGNEYVGNSDEGTLLEYIN